MQQKKTNINDSAGPHVDAVFVSAMSLTVVCEAHMRLAGNLHRCPQTSTAVDCSMLSRGQAASELLCEPSYAASSFQTNDITLNIGSHWKCREALAFRGVPLLMNGVEMRAANVLSVGNSLNRRGGW